MRKPTAYLIVSVMLIITLLFLAGHTTATQINDLTATCLTTPFKKMHETPSIAIWLQTIHVVWNTQDFENSSIRYKKSLDNGKTWNNTTEIISNMTHAYYPVVSVYKNIVHVAWIDYRDTNSEIYYTRSTDNGDTWDTARRLTYDSPIKNNIYDTVICTDKENVYLAWKDYRTGSSEIFFKKSRDSGTTWTNDQRLTTDYSPSYCPSLIADGNYLYIAYQDGGLKPDIYFLKSDSSGNEWNEKTNIVKTQEASTNPCLAVSEKGLYLTWQDDRTGAEEIYLQKSDDRGETWGETQQLSSNSTSCINPKIYAYDENVVVLWQDLSNKTFCISYTTSNDAGTTWTKRKQLTTDTDCYSVSITGEEDNIHIIYQEYYTANWADIWHMGNHSKTPKPVTLEPPEPTVNDKTPGFQFHLLLITIFTMLAVKTILSKKRKK